MAGEKKAALRKLLLEKRDGMSHELATISSKKIHEHLRRVPEFRTATRIGLYYPKGSEVMTQRIIQESLSRGLAVCLPRVEGGDIRFYRVEGMSSLEHGSFDVMEPKPSCEPAPELEAIIVPAVGIDTSLHRLGYGRGFYDRYLASGGAAKIALCYQAQVVRSIPREVHDVPVDYAVTESRVYGL